MKINILVILQLEIRINTKNIKTFFGELYKKGRKKFHSQLDVKNITNNKLFWETTKSFFNEKCTYASKISLVYNDNVISDDQ